MSVTVSLLSLANVDSSPCVVITTENNRILFDTGEGSQRLCVEHSVRLSKVRDIFITKFSTKSIGGLPGLCLTIADSGKSAINVHGPDKLDSFFRSTRFFMRIPDNRLNVDKDCGLNQTSHVCDGVTIHAIRLSTDDSTLSSHVVYVCQTAVQIGKFDLTRALQLGVPKGPLFGQLKNGVTVTLPDGTSVSPQQVLGPSEDSRYFAIVCDLAGPHNDKLIQDIRSCTLLNRLAGTGDLASALDCIVHLSAPTVVHSAAYQQWMRSFAQSVVHLSAHPDHTSSSFIAATRYCNKLSRACPKLFTSMSLDSLAAPTFSNAPQNGTEDLVRCVAGVPLLRFRVLPTKSRGMEPCDLAADLQEEVEKFWSDAVAASPDLDAECATVDSLSQWVSRDLPGGEQQDSSSTAQMGLHLSSARTLLEHGANKLLFLGTGCAVPSKYRNVSGILLQLPESGSSMLLDAGEGTWQQLLRMSVHSATKPGNIALAVQSSAVCAVERAGLSAALQLKAVWVSHPHADHHLGLLTVIIERQRFLTTYRQDSVRFDPLVVIAPPSILRFLEDNCQLDKRLCGAYIPVSSRQLDPYDSCTTGDVFWDERDLESQESSSASDRKGRVFPVSGACKVRSEALLAQARAVLTAMGVASLSNFQVTHCNQSYGLVLEGACRRIGQQQSTTAPFKLVYSGDTRPCERLVQHGAGATILIHEATFEDSKLNEAVSKRHSTVGEALDAGVAMGAFRVVLTHFSQRYPGMPHIVGWNEGEGDAEPCEESLYVRKMRGSDGNECNFLVAFDFMEVSFRDLLWAPSVTSLLMKVFPPESDSATDAADVEQEQEKNGEPAEKKKKKVAGIGPVSAVVGAFALPMGCNCGADSTTDHSCTAIQSTGTISVPSKRKLQP